MAAASACSCRSTPSRAKRKTRVVGEARAVARRREEQAARERAKAAEYAAERGQLPPPDVTIKPASFAVDAPPPRDEGDLRWLFAMDHERDAKRAARKARATAAPSKQAASFEMLREDSDDDAAPPSRRRPSRRPSWPSRRRRSRCRGGMAMTCPVR